MGRWCNDSTMDTLSYGTLTFTNKKEEIMKEIDRLAPYVENITIDQKSIISGVGNYLKSEILYTSKISPLRLVGSLTTITCIIKINIQKDVECDR